MTWNRKPNSLPTSIKDKTGKLLMQKDKILNRWKEYVEELYKEIREHIPAMDLELEDSLITEEVIQIMQKLPKKKAAETTWYTQN